LAIVFARFVMNTALLIESVACVNDDIFFSLVNARA
jgi:hypothetical protein